MGKTRSPGMRLIFAGITGVILMVPLLMVYLLVYDRENQSQIAEDAITAGWGGTQIMTGPILVIPYLAKTRIVETVDGKERTRTEEQRRNLYITPTQQSLKTSLDPDYKEYSIYRSVIYSSKTTGKAVFALPQNLERLEVDRATLLLDQAQLRFGVSDPRGLTEGASVTAGEQELNLEPGNGPKATSGRGFSAALNWNGEGNLSVGWSYGLRGSKSLGLIPRGGETGWVVKSPWQHPSFIGSFLPDKEDTQIDENGFTANYSGITNLALGETLVATADKAGPSDYSDSRVTAEEYADQSSESVSALANVRLVEPVDLYSQVDRAVKYGFLFIGFTFLAYFMFDVIGGARVASAEYLLAGVGLILFFVMLLAFSEVVGFVWAYVVASLSIIGLLTAYSAAVLGSWRRASMIGVLLAGLYATLYILLNLEEWSLMIGSMLLFVALAAVMFASRNIDWSAVKQEEQDEPEGQEATTL